MKTLSVVFASFCLTHLTFAAPSQTVQSPETLKMIHGEMHACKLTSKEKNEETCKGLVHGKVLYVQTLQASSRTKSWVPQNQIVTK